jgi:hypothetical protein
MTMWNVGDPVQLYGLQRQADLNGVLGTIVAAQNDHARWGVRITETGVGVRVRDANMRAPPRDDDDEDEDDVVEAEKTTERRSPLKGYASMLNMTTRHARETNQFYACARCGAHRPMGYRCCGAYAGMHGSRPFR